MKKNLFESEYLQSKIDDWVKEHGRPPVFLLRVVESNGEPPYAEVREVGNPEHVIGLPIADLVMHYWVTEFGVTEFGFGQTGIN